MSSPTFNLLHTRVRYQNGDGLNSDTSGWIAAEDADNFDVNWGTVFSIRARISETNDKGGNNTFKWQINRNSGGWVDVGTGNNTSTPAVIAAGDLRSPDFNDGDTISTQLLTSGGGTFINGTGDTGANFTSTIDAQETEIETAFIIMNFFDNGSQVADADSIEFRIVENDGTAFTGTDNTVTITVNTIDYYIGACPTEGPGRVLHVDGNGNIYFITEPSEITPIFMMLKSTDGGKSWSEMDSTNRPTTGDLEVVDSRLVGDAIHIVHHAGGEVRYHKFLVSTESTNPDTWSITDEAIVTAISETDQACSLEVRSDSTIVAFYRRTNTNEKIYYKIRSSGGTWGSENDLDSTASTDFVGVQCVKGASDKIHIFYKDETNLDIYHKSLTSGDSLGSRQIAYSDPYSSGSGEQTAMTPAVYWDSSGTEEIMIGVHDASDSYMYTVNVTSDGTPETGVQASDNTCASEAEGMTSRQPRADLIVDSATDTVYLLYADNTTLDLYSDENDDNGGWGTDVEEIDGATIHQVRGLVFTHNATNGSAKVLGWVYDNGSNGGTGSQWYDEKSLVTTITGTLTKTLGADTLSGSGDVAVDGDLTETLGADTLSGDGDVAVDGDLAETLADDTLNGAGTVTSGTIEGTLVETLADDTLAGDGDVAVDGDLTETLADDTLSADGDVAVDGDLTKTLADDTLSADGDVAVDGTGTPTEGADTLAGDGDVAIDGAGTPTETADTLAGDGDVAVDGDLTETLADDTLSSDGTVVWPEITGTLAETLADDTLSSDGDVAVDGDSSVTNADDTLSSDGDVEVSGSLAETLADDTLSGDGDVGVAGTLTETNADDTLSSDGDVAVDGSGTPTESVDTLSSEGDVAIDGSGTPTETADTLSSDGDVAVDGDLAETLADDTLEGAGVVGDPPIEGTLVETLADDTLNGDGDVAIDGDLTETLADDTLSADGDVSISGTLTKTLADDTLSADGDVAIDGTGTPSETADTLSSEGDVAIDGAGTPAETADSLNGEGDVAVDGTLTETLTDDTVSSTGAIPVGQTLEIDFEEGDFTDFDSTTNAIDMAVNGTSSMVGSYGLDITIDGDQTATYGQKAHENKLDTVRYRFYIDLSNLTMTSGDWFWGVVQLGLDGSYNGRTLLARFIVTYNGTNKTIQPIAYNDDASNVGTGAVTLSDTEHYIEVELVREDYDGAANGTLKAWLDGVQLGSNRSNLENYNIFHTHDNVYVGALQSLQTGTTGNIYIDHITFRDDTTEIGAAIQGGLNESNSDDTLSSDGEVAVDGSGTPSETADTLSSDGDVAIDGTLAETNADDTLNGIGVVGDAPISGTLVETLADDTLSGDGDVAVDGALIETLADDTLSSDGDVSVSGTLTETEGADTLSSDGDVAIVGSLVETNADDGLAGVGSVDVVGTLAETNADDTLTSTAITITNGTANITNADDTVSSSGQVLIVGLANITNADDGVTSTGLVIISGTLGKSNADDYLSATGTNGTAIESPDVIYYVFNIVRTNSSTLSITRENHMDAKI